MRSRSAIAFSNKHDVGQRLEGERHLHIRERSRVRIYYAPNVPIIPIVPKLTDLSVTGKKTTLKDVHNLLAQIRAVKLGGTTPGQRAEIVLRELCEIEPTLPQFTLIPMKFLKL